MKFERQSKIIQLIEQYDIETQEELANRLMNAGFNVTQATVSRDIRELKLTKIQTEGNRQKYAVLNAAEQNLNEKYVRVLQDGFKSMDMAQNILVIKTLSGMANAVAAALDAMNYNEVLGTLAGDDTIFCATRTEKDTYEVMIKLQKILRKRWPDS